MGKELQTTSGKSQVLSYTLSWLLLEYTCNLQLATYNLSNMSTRTHIPHFWQEAKEHLSENDKVMAEVIARYRGETLVSRGDAFATLARSITGQQISVKAADSVWRKLENAAKSITPEHILELEEPELRACGFSRQKILYLRNIAEYFAANAKEVASWWEAEDAHIMEELCSIKGIGRWTAEMFLIFYLLKPDVLPLDDIGLQKAIEKHYTNGEKRSKKEYQVIAEPWAPYRSVATWYLWRSLDPVPVEY